jgi:hypothetical protein
MSATKTSSFDPIDIIRLWDPDVIEARLREVERQRESLLIALRAAKRIRRQAERDTQPPLPQGHIEID